MSESFKILSDERITRIALHYGFSLKPQFNGNSGLNSYVLTFARAMFEEGKEYEETRTNLAEENLSAANVAIDNMRQEMEETSERFQRAQLVAGQWQQRAELAERQRDELMGNQQPTDNNCSECKGTGSVGMTMARYCPVCKGTGEKPA